MKYFWVWLCIHSFEFAQDFVPHICGINLISYAKLFISIDCGVSHSDSSWLRRGAWLEFRS